MHASRIVARAWPLRRTRVRTACARDVNASAASTSPAYAETQLTAAGRLCVRPRYAMSLHAWSRAALGWGHPSGIPMLRLPATGDACRQRVVVYGLWSREHESIPLASSAGASVAPGRVQETTRTLVEEVARAQVPDVWAALSPDVRAAVAQHAQRESGAYITALMEALQREILDVVDLRGSMVRVVLADKMILNDMFLTTGGAEFVFIRRSGLYFGFLFGLIQVRSTRCAQRRVACRSGWEGRGRREACRFAGLVLKSISH